MKHPGRGGYKFEGPRLTGLEALAYLKCVTESQIKEYHFVSAVILTFLQKRTRSVQARKGKLWIIPREFIMRVAGVHERAAQDLKDLWQEWFDTNLPKIATELQPVTERLNQVNGHGKATGEFVYETKPNSGNGHPKALIAALSLPSPSQRALTFYGIQEVSPND